MHMVMIKKREEKKGVGAAGNVHSPFAYGVHTAAAIWEDEKKKLPDLLA